MKLEFTRAEKKLLELPIEDLQLSVRTFNCLRAANIRTIRELLTYTAEELGEHRMFGQKSISEVETVLENMGLSLRNTKYMKLELVRETSILGEVWYAIYADGSYIKGSSDGVEMSDLYYQIIERKSIEKKKEVLKSVKIDLSLEDTKTQL
jgi:hypothetical protein